MTNNERTDSTDRYVSPETWGRIQDLLTAVLKFCILMATIGFVIGVIAGIFHGVKFGAFNGFRFGVGAMFLFMVFPLIIGMWLIMVCIIIDHIKFEGIPYLER